MNSPFTELKDGVVVCRLDASALYHPSTPGTILTPELQENGAPVIVQADDERSFTMNYRLLSKSMVWAGGMALLDFSQGTVLEEMIPLFQKVTIIYDHDHRSENWIGRVTSVKLNPSFNGNAVAGLDGVIQFVNPDKDDKSDRAWILRGIQNGYVQGMSLGLRITTARSHPDLNAYDFFTLQGKEFDGKLVRFIVTSGERVLEGSVCLAGADGLAGPEQQAQASQSDDSGILATLTGDGWSFPSETPEHNHTHERRPIMAAAKEPAVKENIPAQEPTAAVDVGLDAAQVTEMLTSAQQELETRLSARHKEELQAIQDKFNLELAAQRRETEMERAKSQRVQRLAELDGHLHTLQAQGLPKVLEAVTVKLTDADRQTLDAVELPQGDEVPVSLSLFRLSLSGWQASWFESYLQEVAKLSSVPMDRVTTPGRQDTKTEDVLDAYLAFKKSNKDTFGSDEMYDRFLDAHPQFKADVQQGGIVT